MTDLHRHVLKDIEILDPKYDRLELRVEEIKRAINERIVTLEEIIAELPVHPHMCYFTNKEDIDLGLELGPRPPPKPGMTVIIIADHPEYQPYFKATFAYENACAALQTANRNFKEWKNAKKKKKKKRMKGED